ncbi:precorrin-6y C5,15-methyltransferase (decarboxylating) subunit CbiE [Thiohalophilus sp.]|uniref:precorrin-6y C5,15-methyltransferase (decarboxylating) subunit CbiE n=1 Tax=Thiohalophilus sp. TaxID=3028392 RepID=UPI002ACE2C9B|nr:precorrin-6y C5,15-methyltransferase (decarboxylating) subunit CbiE [Thiohalophilus sp.]MDZ7663653.1 precorrin-6y C5,15-methyltransferase (decarboxylating) subunit CbiE [Thiohalophilus sp.]
MISAIGIGPGDPNYMTRLGEARLQKAELVVGFETVLKLAGELIPASAERVVLTYRNQEDQLAHVAARHAAGARCAVLFMGDFLFSGYQMLERLERACGERVERIPGISAAQLVAAAGDVCFDETTFITFHRRGDLQPFQQRLVNTLQEGWNAIVIPRPWDFMPHEISRYLIEQGVDERHPLEVWENLSGEEDHWSGTLASCPDSFSDMSILLIRTLTPIPSAV